MTPKEQHEFMAAVSAMGPKEMIVLINGFSKQVDGTRFSCGRDLLHETISRVAFGDRAWRRDIPLGAFLHEAMRSVLSVDTRATKSRPLSFEDWMSPAVDDADAFGAPPEAMSIRAEEIAQARIAIDEARKRFAQDEAARQLLSPESLDLTPAQTRKEFKMSEKTYKAARERIARDIRAHHKRPWR